MRYYLTGDWIARSQQLDEIVEDIFDACEQEECQYSFAIDEDHFYKIQKEEQSLYHIDRDLAGGKLDTKLGKDQEGNSIISWGFSGIRFYIDDPDFEELQEAFPELTIGFCDEIDLGMPEPDHENCRMVTFHLPPDCIEVEED